MRLWEGGLYMSEGFQGVLLLFHGSVHAVYRSLFEHWKMILRHAGPALMLIRIVQRKQRTEY